MTTARQMPQAPEIEAAVLGAILIQGAEALEEAGPVLSVDSFYGRAHQHVFQAIRDLKSGMKPIDPLTVTDRLKSMGQLEECGGAHGVSKLGAASVTSAHLVEHCKILAEKQRLRKLITTATGALEMAYGGPDDVDEAIRRVSGEIMELTAQAGGDENLVNAGNLAFLAHMERVEGGAVIGIPTGFTLFDEYLGGWLPGRMTVIAAEAGMGKTALFEQFILSAIAGGHRVSIIQRDMTPEGFFMRLVCRKAGVNVWAATKGFVHGVTRTRLHEAARWLRNQESLFRLLSPARMSGAEFRALVAREKRKYGAELVLLDHFRALAHDSRDYWAGMTRNSQEIRAACNESAVPVCVLNHINRTGADEERPTMSHIKGCDQLKDDADCVCLMWRDGTASGEDKSVECGVHFAKNRWGPEGEGNLLFRGRSMTFEEIKPEPKQEELL